MVMNHHIPIHVISESVAQNIWSCVPDM
jgi:hypothetical protein